MFQLFGTNRSRGLACGYPGIREGEEFRVLGLFFCLVACSLAGLIGRGLAGAEESKKAAVAAVQPKPAELARAYLIPVPLPIAGSVDNHLKRRIDQILSELPRGTARQILVLEFRPAAGKPADASEFERCLSLARYLASERLAPLRTVAYLPAAVKGHAVLAVLACEEIVIAPDAMFGAAGIKETHIDATMQQGYTEIAERRRTVPVAIALGMLDKSAGVQKVQTLDGPRYVLNSELDDLKRKTTISSMESVVQPGDMAVFSGRDLRLKHSFASHLAANRSELASALQVAPQSLEEDPSLGSKWTAVRVDVSGPIQAKSINWVERSIRQRTSGGNANLLCVVVDSPGGSVTDSLRLANFLVSLDPSEVRTVAYVGGEARADAALIAMACDQLVMADEAVLGGPGAVDIAEGQIVEVRRAVRAIADAKQRDWSLWTALVDPSLTLNRFTREGTGQTRIFCPEELALQKDPEAWSRGDTVDTRRGLTGHDAERLGVARFLAADFGEFQQLYHLEGDIESVRPTWAHVLVEHLASPQIAGLLLFVAWFALLIELSHPGLSLAGFLSMLCFVVYFWSQFLHGTAGWLEILLFTAGVVSVLVEVFVVPGTGVFGFGGGLMIVASIILASQTFIIPRNVYQFEQLPGSLMMVAAGGAGAFASMILMRRYLAEAPLLKRLMLPAPDEEAQEKLSRRESLVDYEYLLGKRGRTVTPLVPAGKARFGDDIVDVISDGALTERSVDVYVVKVLGNHVYVQSIEDQT